MKIRVNFLFLLGFLCTFLLSAQIMARESVVRSISNPSNGLIWGGCGITKKAFMFELAKAYGEIYNVNITLQGGGATKGIRGVAKGVLNLGGACRPSMEFNSQERYVQQHPVAWDAIVFIVNKKNPLTSITLSQVRDIYTGEITNWKQLGGSNKNIDLYVRKSKISGVGLTLRELVFTNPDKVFHRRAHRVKSSGPAEKSVERSVTAFAATGISSAKRRDVKILQVAGKYPSYDNIKSGKYILYRPLYLVTKIQERNPLVLDFLDFAQSKKGRDIIRGAGTVPFSDAVHLLGKQYRQNLEAYRASFKFP